MIEFKAIEFFSGIGGLHHALLIVSPNAKVVQAFDVNSVANCCYSHTFGLNPCSTSIDRLSACLLDSLDANVWLLSPPCQPFTAGGKRLDNDDPRSSGLLHLIRVIAQLEHVPDYLLLENVPNFEDSECRNMLVECLLQLGFNIQEYLVSPLQLGIPYDRKRYYLTAYRRIGHGSKQVSERGRLNEPIIRDLSNEFVKPKLISDYLDQKCSIKDRNATCESEDEYLVPESFISRQKFLNVDLVKPSEFRVSTITKAYGTYHLKSGSFLQTDCLDVILLLPFRVLIMANF